MPTDVLGLLAGAPLAVALSGVVVVLGAGFVQGLTGMGFAVVFTPLLVLVLPYPHAIVLMSLLLGSILSLGVLVQTRHCLQPRHSWPLLAGAILGTPVGIALLAVLEARVLMLCIAVLALVVAAVGMVQLPGAIRRESRAAVIAGLLGGFLNGSTSMGGSAPALLAAIQGWPVQQSRAALVAFNLASYALAFIVATVKGIGGASLVLSSLWLLPLAALGSLLGNRIAPRLSQKVFARTLMVVVGSSGIVGLFSVL